MKVKWDGVKSLPEPRCITSTSPLCLCANYLDKLVCCDLLGNSAGRFPPSYCQTAHVMLGCFTRSFCRQWFVQRVCASCSHGAPSSTGIQRWWDGWASEPAAVPAERVGWQAGADSGGGCALHLQPVPAECQGRASSWFTLCHSPDKMSGNVTPFLTSRSETH